jgi:hypothetical protein
MIPESFLKAKSVYLFVLIFSFPFVAKADALEGLGQAIFYGSLIFVALIAVSPLLVALINHVFKIVATKNIVSKIYGFFYLMLGDFLVTYNPMLTSKSITLVNVGHILFFLGLLILGLVYFKNSKLTSFERDQANTHFKWSTVMGNPNRPMVLSVLALLYINKLIQLLATVQFYTYKWQAILFILLVAVIFVGLWKMLNWVFVPLVLFESYFLFSPIANGYFDLRSVIMSVLSVGIGIYYLQKWYQTANR